MREMPPAVPPLPQPNAQLDARAQFFATHAAAAAYVVLIEKLRATECI